MKYLVKLIILIRCLKIQGGLEWKVLKKITDYGQNVTLFCNVSNCCPKHAGWDKYTPVRQTIFIDAKTWKPNEKYDGKNFTDGYTLVIQNLTKEDLNVSYACVYGSTIGDKQSLLEDNVFNYISTTQHNGPIHNITLSVENMGTTQQTGPIDNRNLSAGEIVGIVFGVFVVVVSVVSSVIFFWKRRREMHRNIGNRNAGSNEDVPLINPFLEEPNDIHCIEGEDAILTCKLRPDTPPVKWLKNFRELTQNEKYIISMEDTQHKLTLKNTTESDSGDYYVQVGFFSKKIQLNITEIPREISAEERNTYMDAIKSGEEVRQYVRIQVIGKDRVGKTSLVHRLLFLDEGKYDGKSTDGIDINRKCQIRTSDGEWIVGEVDTENEIIKRILQATNINQRGTDQLSADEKPYETEQIHNGQEPIQIKEPKIGTKTLNEQDKAPKSNDKTQYTSNTSAVSNTNLEEDKLNMGEKVEKQNNPDKISDSFALSARNQQSFSDKHDNITETMMEKMNEIILNARAKKEKMTSEGLIECGIWDFAGQKDYYASHQTFFTPHAIYLLVADINDEIKAIKHDEELDFDTVGDYIDFWLDSIHCFCKDLSVVKLCPPVILVCTGTDTIEKNVDFKTKYNENFQNVFGGQRKADHRRGIYFISNTEFLEEDFKEIKRLRTHISEIAKQMTYFGEKLPTRWIQLENALGVLKGANEHVLLFKNMKKIAQENLIKEEELLLFLNYQHKIGNLIFFKEIREYIILQPEWLVKCYRCLVCDCHPDKRNFNMICSTEWDQLISKGQLSNALINQLFEKEPLLKFEDYQAHLLKVMEQCDIIVKPDSSNNESHTPDVYYLPCMIEKSASYNSIKETFISNNSNVSITPWLVLEFDFLPLAYFNHILFHYIRNFDVCKLKSESPAIYRGKSVFYIDKLTKFIICFSHNAISLQIWEWDDVRDRLYQNVLNQLCDIVESIKRKLDQNINYSIKAKCNSGNYSKSAGRISFEDLTERDIYMCEEHNCTHSKAKIENTWLKHAAFRRRSRNYVRMSVIVLEVLSGVLYDRLYIDTKTGELLDRNKLDITEMCKKYCALKINFPSKGFRKIEKVDEISTNEDTIGDDIQRIRVIRNEMQHSSVFALDDTRYQTLITIVHDMLTRFDQRNNPAGESYVKRLNEIRKMELETRSFEEIKERMKAGLLEKFHAVIDSMVSDAWSIG